jgi:hypothetical protein
MNLWKMILIFFTFRWLFESSKNSIGSSNGANLCNDYNHNGICDEEEKGYCPSLDFDEPDDEQVWSSMTWLDDYDDWGSSYSDDDED